MELGLEAGLEPASGEPYRRFTDEAIPPFDDVKLLQGINQPTI